MPSLWPTRATVSTLHRASRPARATTANLSERRPMRGIYRAAVREGTLTPRPPSPLPALPRTSGEQARARGEPGRLDLFSLRLPLFRRGETRASRGPSPRRERGRGGEGSEIVLACPP